MGLGSLLVFSLSKARQRANEQKALQADGIDPIEHRQKVKKSAKVIQATCTFDDAASQLIEANRSEWKNRKHEAQWVATLEGYASPIIGKMSVADVTPEHVLQILMPIWTTKTETAARLRGRIENVLDWAKVKGYRTGENPALWKGHLSHALPKPSKVKKSGNHAALPFIEMAEFMKSLRGMAGEASLAFQLIILTACRTNEALKAKWSEINFEEKIWTVPPERMKSGREHRIALSSSALEILNTMKVRHSEGFIFKGRLSGAMSNMACLQILKRMNRTDITVHGFRSTFRDWCSETTNYNKDVAEMALSHVVEDKTEAAYRRGDLLDKRASLMQEWAEFCG